MQVEVWSEDNYDFLKREENPYEYFKGKFETPQLAIDFIKESLYEELKEILKRDPNASDEQIIQTYKMYGSDFYLKKSTEGFSSWSYIEENASKLIAKIKQNLHA